MSFRAIETRYRGYRFRSRLEARWAVYFDAIGLEWQYEIEGFVLENGDYYLPDFYLPQVAMWAEAKPVSFSKCEELKLDLLSKGSGKACIELVGVPDVKLYRYRFWDDSAGGIDILHCALSMFRDYPIVESRFHSEIGQLDDVSDIVQFDDIAPAVGLSREARFS